MQRDVDSILTWTRQPAWVGANPSTRVEGAKKLSMGVEGTTQVLRAQPNADGQRSGWLTAEEAAEYLQVRTRTLLQWARQGKVKGYVLSGPRRHVWRFRLVDLDATLELPSVCPEGIVQ